MINVSAEVQNILAAAQSKAGRGKVDLSTCTVEILDTILACGVRERASDLHIEPFDRFTRVRLRIDGQLMNVLELDNEYNVNLTNCIEVICNLHTDAAMKRTSQDGRFSRYIGAQNYDFRVSTFPTIAGEKMTIRILYEDNGLYDITNLGLTEYDLTRLEKLLQRTEGLVVVSGPTASGKTTTLYAILNRLHSIHKNIVTLENPVEYRIAGMNQCEVNTKANFGFADGLRAILRQDPDIILVGEIRDEETADTTIRVAVSGHLVFSTIHARGSIGTVVRLLNMGLEPFMISYAMNGSIAQRLVRRVCPQCREAIKPDFRVLNYLRNEYALDLNEVLYHTAEGEEKPKDTVPIEEMTFYKGKGCDYCNQTGYRGRVAIFEIVMFDDEMREAILQKVPMKELYRVAKSRGFRPLAQDGLIKVQQGLTTLEEVYSVLVN